MKSFKIYQPILIIFTLLGVYMPPADSASMANIVGMYTNKDMESQSQIVLLEDNTFCFTFVGGSLDMIKAGHWKFIDTDTVQLQETKRSQPIHPAIANNIDRLGPVLVGINFDGYTLSDAYSAIFATSSSDEMPATFRPLFPAHTDSWALTYALPLMPADKVRYFYIGDVEMGPRGPTQKLRVTQYRLDGYDTVRIGFNQQQAEKALDMKAHVTGQTVTIGGTKFGYKTELTPELVSQVREVCINPALQQNNHHHPDKDNRPQQNKATELVPVKTFYLDASVIAGEPFFSVKDTGNTTPTDEIRILVESERARMQTLFDAASSDPKNINDFLLLVDDIVGKKNRITMHMPLMMDLLTKLLVKTNSSGDFKNSEKIFYNFMEHVYPAAKRIKETTVIDNISNIASQGIVLSIVTKNADISKIVFDQILGADFDITKHKNRLLIYNVACYYAINKNKKEMLVAITQARINKVSKQQFIDDADFKKYSNDPDFLQAIE